MFDSALAWTPFLLSPIGLPQAVAQQWANKHGFSMDRYIRDGSFFLDVVLTTPIPHAVLIAARVWKSYAVPIRDGAGHNVRFLQLVKPLVDAIEAADDNDVYMLDGQLGPEDFNEIADNMRQMLAFVPEHHVLLRAQSANFIKRLDGVRRNLLTQQFRAKQRCFTIEHLLQCVCLSGLLKRAEYTQDVVIRALKIAVTDSGRLEHLVKVIHENRVIPSPSTLLRNRLTIHLGYCVWKQGQVLLLLSDEGGFVGWGSLDLSPRIGHEWLLSLRTDMSVSNLERAVDLVLQLGTTSVDRDKELDIELRGKCFLTLKVEVHLFSQMMPNEK